MNFRAIHKESDKKTRKQPKQETKETPKKSTALSMIRRTPRPESHQIEKQIPTRGKESFDQTFCERDTKDLRKNLKDQGQLSQLIQDYRSENERCAKRIQELQEKLKVTQGR